MSSRLYAIGVGPGDPELLTRKAERILRSVPVICSPTGAVDAAILNLLARAEREAEAQAFTRELDRFVMRAAAYLGDS